MKSTIELGGSSKCICSDSDSSRAAAVLLLNYAKFFCFFSFVVYDSNMADVVNTFRLRVYFSSNT